MDWDKFKFSISVLLFFVLVALALPTFSFNIGDQKFLYPNIDFSLIDSSSQLGNLRRGRGLYPTKEVRASVDFSTATLDDSKRGEVLNEYLLRIRERARLSGFYDVEIWSEVVDSTYYLVFNYPDHYKSVDKYTEWLTGKGVINFSVFSQTLQSAGITDLDVRGQIIITYISQLGSHLQFQFDAAKKGQLTQLLTPQSEQQVGFFLMDVDGKEQFFVRQYELNDEASNTVRALPINYSDTESEDKNILLSIIRTYFSERKALDYSFIVNPHVETIPSEMSADGTRFVAIMAFVSVLAIGVLIFIKFKLIGFTKYILMVGSFLSLYVVILKYTNTMLSIGTIVGFIAVYILGLHFILKYMGVDDEDDLKLLSVKLRDMSLLIILLAIFLGVMVKGIWLGYDAIGSILIGGVSLYFMNLFNFVAISVLKSKNETT